MKIQEFFDKGYYVNLDRRTDRRTYIENILFTMGILDFCERVPGIDGIKYDNYIMRHHCFSQTFYNLFQNALQLNLNSIVIFEDDFAIYENGLENIENSLHQLNVNKLEWDIIYFGGYIGGKTAKKVANNLLKIDGALTTHGIGISKKTIQYVVDNFIPFSDSSLDLWLNAKGSENKIHNIYCTYPFSTYQVDIFSSDLDAYYHTGNLHHWKSNFFTGNIE